MYIRRNMNRTLAFLLALILLLPFMPGEVFAQDTVAAPFQDGDQVVIYTPTAKKALSGKYSGHYNQGVDITVDAQGSMTGFDPATDLWTVVDNGDGTYSFAQNGQNLGMQDDYQSMSLGSAHDTWKLIPQSNGTFHVENTGRPGNMMQWYASKGNWSAYHTIYPGNESNFELQFYVYDETTTDTQDPTTPSVTEMPIKNGDQVVIYAPEKNKALSGNYSGYYNKAVDVSVDSSGTLTGFDPAMDVWNVTENADGTFSFAVNGKNIGMSNGTYTSMPLGEVNDHWEITDNGDGTYYLKNTVRNMYMQYSDKYNTWSAYGTIAAASEGSFRLQFFKVEKDNDPTTDPVVVDGLDIVCDPTSGASVKTGDTIVLKAAEGVKIFYTVTTDGTEPADPDPQVSEQEYTEPISVTATPLKIKAVAYNPTDETTGSVVSLSYVEPVSLDGYSLYFGQLHSHTNISDGSGSVTEAFAHAQQVENLDFLAVTDHSNWFDNEASVHMDTADAETISTNFGMGRKAARDYTTDTFVGIYGFEMTWSGGSPGHINTFNSKGFESRNQPPYRKGSSMDVLKAYFDTLKANPETISQFNHPGSTFGDFMDFALYDPVIDRQMTMVEVGNGEGPIGGSGYWTSYPLYTRALDKGWHVAPTNNQDNHKGNWGDSNTARSVVLATELTESAIFDALRNYRVYATEDNDLSILYSLNGNAMGSILGDQESITITAGISDPTDAGSSTVEVIVNGGEVLASKTFEGNTADLTFENLSTNPSYFYLRITQADGDIAVTAPVWVGTTVSAGISNTRSDLKLPEVGQSITLTSDIYNNTSTAMTVNALTYTIAGEDTPFHTADAKTIADIASGSSQPYSFEYAPTRAGELTVNVVMEATIDAETYTFTDVLKLNVIHPSLATKVLVDGSHYNDYVSGYYAGNISELVDLGVDNNIQVRVTEPGEEITAETLQDVSLLIVSAPLRKTSKYTDGMQITTYEDTFVQTVADYVKAGGTVIITGLADYQDGALPYTTYAQQNRLLEAMGSSMRINDDELLDQEKNGGQPYRLYFTEFNITSSDPVVAQILQGTEGKEYSAYSGSSVDKGNGEAMVFGHDSTYSINSKTPAQGHEKPVLKAADPYSADTAVVPKGEVVAMATEQVGEGRVYVSGTVFMSNFELPAQGDVFYANRPIMKNILNLTQKEPELSTILEARQGEAGDVFTVIGTVANGTAETGNAFFDTIYIQDAKGNGINVFPVNDDSLQRGDTVKITGSVGSYQGEKQLTVISLEKLEETKDIVISDTTVSEAADYDANFGKLVRTEGTVKAINMAGNIVESVIVEDPATKDTVRVFIDGYIGYSDETTPKLETIKVGDTLSVVGFVSHDAQDARLRVRDRSEITTVEKPVDPVKPQPKPVDPVIVTPVTPVEPKKNETLYTKTPLFVRPEKNSDKSLGILPAATKITGVTDGAWFVINYDGKTAYVARKFLDTAPPSLTVDGYLTESLYVRPEKNSEESLGILPKGAYIEGTADGAWLRIRYDGKTAYIAGSYLTEEKPKTQRFGYTQSAIYVRPEKGSDAYLGILPLGTYVTGVEDGAWIRIRYEGKTAYIAKFLVDKTAPIRSGETTSAIYVRPEKNSKQYVGILSEGSSVQGIVEGAWMRIIYNGESAYIATQFVK